MGHCPGHGPLNPSGSTAHERRARSPAPVSRRRQRHLRHRGRTSFVIGKAASIIIAAPERCCCREDRNTTGVHWPHHVPRYRSLDRCLPRQRLPQIPIAPQRPRPSCTSNRGFLPWRLSDAGPHAQSRCRDRAGIRNPSQEQTLASRRKAVSCFLFGLWGLPTVRNWKQGGPHRGGQTR